MSVRIRASRGHFVMCHKENGTHYRSILIYLTLLSSQSQHSIQRLLLEGVKKPATSRVGWFCVCMEFGGFVFPRRKSNGLGL